MSKSEISNRGWIQVGNNKMAALVIHKYTDEWVSAGYYQNGLKVVKDEFVFSNGLWQFKLDPPCGIEIKDQFLVGKIKVGPYGSN